MSDSNKTLLDIRDLSVDYETDTKPESFAGIWRISRFSGRNWRW